MKVCFVTYDQINDLTADDAVAAAWLKTQGIAVFPASWEDENISWDSFDAIIIRSTWNYFLRIEEFNNWLDKLVQLGCLVFNPVSIIKLNQNKKYLLDLSEEGKNVPALTYLPHDSRVHISEILLVNDWDKAVIKPAVSGGAYNTWVTSKSTAAADSIRLNELLKEREYIIQKYLNEIVTDGEISLIFFNKGFSHAVIKNPNGGDFRVQTKYGGTVFEFCPNERMISEAAAFLAHIQEPLLYARVDGVMVNDHFQLMELELVEPDLFFSKNEKASTNFCRALMDLMKKAP